MEIPAYLLQSWLDEEQSSSLYTYDYWNNRDLEKQKAWDVTEHGFSQMESHIENRGLWSQFMELCDSIDIQGRGLSLASGTCWLEGMILREFQHLKHMSCLDFSKHRIHEIAPQVLGHFEIDAKRTDLIHGSFYDIKLENESCDLIVLCQAFHHAEDPEKILAEMYRVLTPKGHVVIMGEHYFSVVQMLVARLKYHVKWFLNYKNIRRRCSGFFPSYQDLFPTSLEKGDIHYSLDQYRLLFEKYKFDFQHKIMPSLGIQGFLLNKKS